MKIDFGRILSYLCQNTMEHIAVTLLYCCVIHLIHSLYLMLLSIILKLHACTVLKIHFKGYEMYLPAQMHVGAVSYICCMCKHIQNLFPLIMSRWLLYSQSPPIRKQVLSRWYHLDAQWRLNSVALNWFSRLSKSRKVYIAQLHSQLVAS